ncbi:hypothetical protein [Peribacillus frigoritolerans]|uniref:hypothetical protein n=1 Tax=Peribacillus frigoritolerans TaxID=450367 RepID=UPI0022308940|nr:hypothetical protein [Peribacillus frigoritolerans]UZD46035.1 hypothetical protein OMJ04_20905 [Peribacillus frigoritolerans]
MKKIERIFDLFVICLPLFILMLVIHSPTEFVSMILEFNSNMHWSEKRVGLYAIYFIEIFMIATLWDFVILRLSNFVYSLYTELTERFIRKKWILIKLIRFYYGFQKIYYHLRLGIIQISIRSKPKLIDDLTAPIFTDWLKFFFNLFKSTYSILAALLTLLTFNYSIIYGGLESIKDQWDNLFFLLWSNSSKLSAVVVVVLLIFLLYFVSRYGVTRRAIAQANKKKLEDVIQLFRELEKPVLDIILKGSKNLEYALNCYDSIYESWTLKKYKTLENQKRTESLRSIDFDFLFDDITELNDLIKILEAINKSENRMFGIWYTNYKFELRRFINITRLNQLEYYERVLFTKKGFNKMSNVNQNRQVMKIDEKRLSEEYAFNQYKLNMNIIDGLELLYAFYRYIEVSNKILHMDSDKVGRGIRLFTGKE